MFVIRYSAPAKADLKEIADYLVQEADNRVAAAVVKRIRTHVRTLARDAPPYRERQELGRGRRAILIGPYIAFYRIQENTVFVLRILHSARDIKPKLFEG